jgi:hypothetical protein
VDGDEEDRTAQLKRLRLTIAEQWRDGRTKEIVLRVLDEMAHEAYEETGREGPA